MVSRTDGSPKVPLDPSSTLSDFPIASLRSNWKKVSSTDNLQAFEEGAEGACSAPNSLRSRILGRCMMLLAAVLLLAECAVLVVKLRLVPSAWSTVQAVQAASYVSYLAPLMVPMAFLAVTLNWFNLKLFKHNS